MNRDECLLAALEATHEIKQKLEGFSFPALSYELEHVLDALLDLELPLKLLLADEVLEEHLGRSGAIEEYIEGMLSIRPCKA